MDLTTKVNLVRNLLTTKELPASVGASLLDINRTSIYYKGSPVSDDELACKEIIDHLHTDNPTWGARQMSAQLKARGYIEVQGQGVTRIITVLKEPPVSKHSYKKEIIETMIDKYMEDFKDSETLNDRIEVGKVILRLLEKL